jgi:hypothetical protein
VTTSEPGRTDAAANIAQPWPAATCRDRARQSRQAGLVPADLEARLDAHARLESARLASRLESPGEKIRQAIAPLTPSPVDRVIGGHSLRSLAGRLVGTQITRLRTRVEEVADSARSALLAAAEALDRPGQHGHPELAGPLDQVVDRMASLERLLNDGEALAALRRRIEVLEAAQAGSSRPPHEGGPGTA